jgi:hypothetical protein
LALDLDLFTALDEGATTVAAAAPRCQASERGTRARTARARRPA